MIQKLDTGNKVIPVTLMTKWKERGGYGWSVEQRNSEFYSEIQRRGPHAFQLLVQSLQRSGHEKLVYLLEPTLSVPEADEEDQPNILRHLEYYKQEGIPYVYVDKNWQGVECLKDREVLQNFFCGLGYQNWEDPGPRDDVESLIVLNFSNLNNGGVNREHNWIHDHFNQPFLYTKPKILLSFRYEGSKKNMKSAEQDSGGRPTLYQDILQVKIFIDRSNKGPEQVSEEVNHLIRIFGMDDPESLEDKLHKLSENMQLHQQNIGFSKQFRLKRRHQESTLL